MTNTQILRNFLKFKKNVGLPLSRVKKNSGLRVFQRQLHVKNLMRIPKIAPLLITNILQLRFPYREIAIANNNFGERAAFLHTAALWPGAQVRAQTQLLPTNRQNLLPIGALPINTEAFLLFNKKNAKSTYARSSGASLYKKKIEKKSKSVCVVLPSKKEIFLPQQT